MNSRLSLPTNWKLKTLAVNALQPGRDAMLASIIRYPMRFALVGRELRPELMFSPAAAALTFALTRWRELERSSPYPSFSEMPSWLQQVFRNDPDVCATAQRYVNKLKKVKTRENVVSVVNSFSWLRRAIDRYQQRGGYLNVGANKESESPCPRLMARESNPASAGVERLSTLNWDLNRMASATYLPFGGILLSHKFTAESFFAGWLDKHGFTCVKKGPGGTWLAIRQQTGTCYRPILAFDRLVFAASSRSRTAGQRHWERQKVDGWAIIFNCDLPAAPVYLVSKSFLEQLRTAGVVNHKYQGKSADIRESLLGVLQTHQADRPAS